MQDENSVLEESLINILLNNADAVKDWIVGPVGSLKYFDGSHANIIKGIIWANNEGVQLTRNSYKSFVETICGSPMEVAAEVSVYNRCHMRLTKRDDLPMLADKVKQAYIRRKSVEYIRIYNDERQSRGELEANRILATRLTTLENDTITSKTAYVDIAEAKGDFMKDLEERRVNPMKRLTCGIPEIDETMSVGFKEGTLTIFCAAPGTFKCGSGKDLVQIEGGGRLTISEYFDRYERCDCKPKILSFNEVSRKVYYQDVQFIQSNGKKPCLKIQSKMGFSTEVTGNHPVLTFGGYKRADEIKESDYIAISRRSSFGNTVPPAHIPSWLGCMIGDGGMSQIGYNFTNADKIIVESMLSLTESLGGKMVPLYKTDDNVCFRVNGLRKIGIIYGLDGHLSITKRLHPEIFTWNEMALTDLLSAMYGCDGRISVRRAKKRGGVGDKICAEVIYSTSSYGLAQDVRDMLLKFGLVAKLLKFISKLGDHSRESYRVIIAAGKNVATFIRRIGFLGEKQKIAESILSELDERVDNPNADIIPSLIWDTISRKMKEKGKSYFDCRRTVMGGKWRRGRGGNCGHQGKPMSRRVLGRIAKYLGDDPELTAIAESDVFWDKVETISPSDVQETFDIAMPTHHNFVCDNIITHNTTIMMNVALNIFKQDHVEESKRTKENVLFLPLEGPHEMMIQKIVSRETRIPFHKIEHANELNDAEIRRITEEFDKWQSLSNRFKILKISDRAKVSTIRAEIERRISYFHPRVVFIDYIDNVLPDRREARNDLELRGMFEDIIKMAEYYGFAAVTAAKLTRESLKRMRETKDGKQELDSTDVHGGQEFGGNATNMYGQIRCPTEPTSKLDFFCMKSRFGQNTFRNGKMKATLVVDPAIGSIKSPDDMSPCWSTDSPLIDAASLPPTPTDKESPF